MHSSVDSSTADIGSPQPAAIPRLGQAERRAPRARPERFSPLPGEQIRLYDSDCELTLLGTLEQISQSGLALAWSQPLRVLPPGAKIGQLLLCAGKDSFACGPAHVVREIALEGNGDLRAGAGVAFESEQASLIDSLANRLQSASYVSTELERKASKERSRRSNASAFTIDKFYSHRSPDLFAKCDDFQAWVEDMQAQGLYQRLFRVTVTGALDSRIVVFDPVARRERPMLCFDSNGYLSLHRHRRVIERVAQVTKDVGSGTPSAQLLGGTSRHLRELEIELSALHGRDDTVVFSSGFAANLGAIAALVRKNDAVVRDRFAHASIQEACRSAAAQYNKAFSHNDMASLERHLQRADAAGCDGKLIVTDGVFSMHGRVAPLPELVALAKRYRARLMIDDAHGVGVLGASGSGIEEHYAMPGSVDVLMGTLSKSFGSLGGYVSGSRELIDYLRFFAPSSMFTTSLPAPLCAGVTEAIRILRQEPEHHAKLWHNIRTFVPALRAAGFVVPAPDSAIVPIFIGSDALMFRFNRELFDAGIKCSSVAYPAVPKGDAILRTSLTASHTDSELAQALEVLTKLGAKFGILHRSQAELREMSARAA